MSDILQEIISWLHQQQDWLQDAAERFHNSGSLSEADINHLVDRLKSDEGRRVTTARHFEGLGRGSQGTAELRLLSLGDIKGIENLAPRRPLDFGTGNLVVVYGPNGSGKSSYTRIMKKACGKPLAKDLKTHAFRAPPTERKCTIRYKAGGVEQTVPWSPTESSIIDLQAVDFFDADAATFYPSKETEASYTPPTVAFFEGLADACNQVKAKLQTEQALLVSALPVLPAEHEGTKAGKAYQGLKADFSVADHQCLTSWSDDEQLALGLIVERLKAVDPSLAARQKRATKTQMDQLVAELQSAGTVLALDSIQAIRNAKSDAEGKRKVATEAARACTESSKLDGIGTETWNALWKAARQYSQTPYPDQDFPVTKPGSRCLLCHQELSVEAQLRLHDFESFVQGVVESEAEDAETLYKSFLDGLPNALSAEEIRTRCEAAGIAQEPYLRILDNFWERVTKASDALRYGESEYIVPPLALPDDFIDTLKTRSTTLELEAKQYDEDARTFDRSSAQSQEKELNAKEWVSQQSDAIQKEIERLKKVWTNEELIRFTNSRQISVKAGEIAEKVITTAYVERFNAELRSLGAAHIQVELVKTRTEHGKALHQLRLRGATSTLAVPESVLSDGERRIVSLAAFLADVAEKPYAAPFVFDDPISSLDHDFEWQVTQRLAELARDRQVLVFTHRLSLYGAIEDAAKKHGDDWRNLNLERRYIESFGGESGHPADEAVWNVNTKKANNILLTRLVEAQRAVATSGGEGYRLHAQGICSDFRKLLERTIEDDLLSGVVKRHRRSVTTDNILGKLPLITPEDCKFIDDMMTKYSCYEHSQSQEAPIFLPPEAVLRADIEGLREWRERFNQRGGTHA